MIADLVRTIADLPMLLGDPAHPWKTLDVQYDKPRVERVWTQVGNNRLSLHRIHPCEGPLFHPHPWPSAMWLASGAYAMGVGWAPPGSTEEPEEAARVTLGEGSYYQMLNPRTWHWVNPVGTPVMSIMLTAPPWEMPPEFPKYGRGHEHKELAPEVRDEILDWFRKKLSRP